jgi:hypothetical protein
MGLRDATRAGPSETAFAPEHLGPNTMRDIGQVRPGSAPHASTVEWSPPPGGYSGSFARDPASGEPTVAGQRRYSTGFPRLGT